ncbi:hypothetical protein MRX96_030720 [Rhipicephalus microplus]
MFHCVLFKQARYVRDPQLVRRSGGASRAQCPVIAERATLELCILFVPSLECNNGEKIPLQDLHLNRTFGRQKGADTGEEDTARTIVPARRSGAHAGPSAAKPVAPC